METSQPDKEPEHSPLSVMLGLGSVFLITAATTLRADNPDLSYAHLGLFFTQLGSSIFFFRCAFRMWVNRNDEPWSMQARLIDGMLSWAALLSFAASLLVAVLVLKAAWRLPSLDLVMLGVLSIPGPIIAYIVRKKLREIFEDAQRTVA
jgi:hypothetical protein